MREPENNVLRVRALVHLFTTDSGGRLTAIANKYRPNIRVKNIDGYAGFLLGEGRIMQPGSTGMVELAMLGSANFLSELHIGQEFDIHEGNKEIGQGTVREIIEGPIGRLII